MINNSLLVEKQLVVGVTGGVNFQSEVKSIDYLNTLQYW